MTPATPRAGSPQVQAASESTRLEAEVRALRAGERRYCEDCRFYQIGSVSKEPSYARCLKPYTETKAVELVARVSPPIRFCETTRENSNACGMAGNWFERKLVSRYSENGAGE